MQEVPSFRSASDDASVEEATKEVGLVLAGKSRANHIKRPRTAYILFLDQMKNKYFEEYPNSTYNEYQKHAGRLWKSLSHQEKEPWLRAEEKTRKEFYQEMYELQHSLAEKHSDAVPKPTCNGKAISSKSAFPSFVEAMRGQILLENPGFNYNQVQKELSSTWRNMSAEEKQVWASVDQATNEVPEVEFADDKVRPKRKKKEMMLPRGPRSAYTLFYQCARKQLATERPDLSFREFPTVCSQLWREMNPTERALWQQDAIKDRERYDRELLELAQNQTIDSESVAKISRKRRLGGISPVRDIESKREKSSKKNEKPVSSNGEAWRPVDEEAGSAWMHPPGHDPRLQDEFQAYHTPDTMFMMDGDDSTIPMMSIDPDHSEELFTFSRSSGDKSDVNFFDEHERSLRAILDSYDNMQMQSNSSTDKSVIGSFFSTDALLEDQVLNNRKI